MQRFFYRLLRMGITGGAAVSLFGGCGWHHPHKPKSYDRAISNEDKDPTYHSDPERADEEVRDVQ